jgi:predicted alpha/beta superfamily hydrolase
MQPTRTVRLCHGSTGLIWLLLWALGVSLLLLPSAEGAETISVGLGYEIESNILKESRPIRVHMPTGVQPDDRFPTAYILDGEEDFALAVAILETLNRAGRVPPMIVVGIDNLHRIYDLTTLDADYNGPESGGADQFFEFLRKELIPWVEERFPAAPHRTLVGHSIGGVLQLHGLISFPELFASQVMISPSLWWDNGSLPARFDTWLKEVDKKRRLPILYLSLANEGANDPHSDMRRAFAKMESVLDRHKFLVSRSERLDDFDHITTLIPALTNGFETTFSGWSMEDYYERGDIGGLRQHVDSLASVYPFTVRPTNGFDFALLCRALTREGRPVEASDHLEWGRSHFPESIAIHNFLGEAYEAQGRFQEALHVYRESRRIAQTTSSPMIGWIDRRIKVVESELANNG